MSNKDYDIFSYSRTSSVYFYSSIIFHSSEIEVASLYTNNDSLVYEWIGTNGEFAINHNNGGTDNFKLINTSNDTTFYELEIE